MWTDSKGLQVNKKVVIEVEVKPVRGYLIRRVVFH